MTLSILVLALVTLQRLGELAWARRNTARLIARGGMESGAEHYPVMVGLHAAWLAGLWLIARNRPVDPGWIAVYLILQLARAWTLWSLGERWTTRIISLPGEPLVRRGPYRFFAHPNYAVVAGEIAVLPLVFHLAAYAAVFSALNASVLWVRIRAEIRALARSQAAGEVTPDRSGPANGRSPGPPRRTG